MVEQTVQNTMVDDREERVTTTCFIYFIHLGLFASLFVKIMIDKEDVRCMTSSNTLAISVIDDISHMACYWLAIATLFVSLIESYHNSCGQYIPLSYAQKQIGVLFGTCTTSFVVCSTSQIILHKYYSEKCVVDRIPSDVQVVAMFVGIAGTTCISMFHLLVKRKTTVHLRPQTL